MRAVVCVGTFLALLTFSEGAASGGLHRGRVLAQNRAAALLSEAIFDDNVPAVKQLIKCKCPEVLEAPQTLSRVNAGNGGTALHLAVELRNLPIVKLLVKAGAEINARSTVQATPLHVAAISSKPITAFLIKKGAKLNVKDELGDSPLHYSVINKNVETTKELLAAGADPDIKDKGSYTPLHEAAALGEAKLVEMLIKKGANPKAVTKDGRTPGDVVCKCISDSSCKVCDPVRTREVMKPPPPPPMSPPPMMCDAMCDPLDKSLSPADRLRCKLCALEKQKEEEKRSNG